MFLLFLEMNLYIVVFSNYTYKLKQRRARVEKSLRKMCSIPSTNWFEDRKSYAASCPFLKLLAIMANRRSAMIPGRHENSRKVLLSSICALTAFG